MAEISTGIARKRVLVFGASGTIGRATLRQLKSDGYDVTGVVRSASDRRDEASAAWPSDAKLRFCDFANSDSVSKDVFRNESFDVVVSCLASRTGEKKDAYFVDYEANMQILRAAKSAGAEHMILVSAICVQKPRLAFQHAKLAFEKELIASGLTYSIVRPTAFFKSLSGQIQRVKRGKPFLVFGDGTHTRCKPISDADLGRYISECITNPERHDRTLPIGGPGPAISPREQGEMLFELLNMKPRFRYVPIALLTSFVRILGAVGKLFERAQPAAEYARIARYYATESMLVFDDDRKVYSDAATPETGDDTLFEHYAKVLDTDH